MGAYSLGKMVSLLIDELAVEHGERLEWRGRCAAHGAGILTNE